MLRRDFSTISNKTCQLQHKTTPPENGLLQPDKALKSHWLLVS